MAYADTDRASRLVGRLSQILLRHEHLFDEFLDNLQRQRVETPVHHVQEGGVPNHVRQHSVRQPTNTQVLNKATPNPL
ncbi:hypothetical protein KIN20_013685 [Parelaphostrongylus tenuis]|uniref:Uncharacterized protein n=1 Tax=Parelaphostrongylus tenuis TaxID=148309 RepID=A0AAD5MUV0_PARTN|nr:hypothetical protein KIN20_013685 [Parelaphostrongylus tenuis]